jgi:hypothetical protein
MAQQRQKLEAPRSYTSVGAEDKEGRTPSHKVTENKSVEVVGILERKQEQGR